MANWPISSEPPRGNGYSVATEGELPSLQPMFWRTFNWIVSCLKNMKYADQNGFGQGKEPVNGVEAGKIVIDQGVTEIVAGENVTLSATRGSGSGVVTIDATGSSGVTVNGTDGSSHAGSTYTYASASDSNVEVKLNSDGKMTVGVYWV